MNFDEWITQNLTIINNNNVNVIDWGNGIKTPVSAFYDFFYSVGQTALDNNLDVKQEILKTDLGKQFSNCWD